MKNVLYVFMLPLIIIGCRSGTPVAQNTPTAPITFTFLQINDVYEISGLENGRVGGLARVATLRKRLLAEDPETITVIAGDFLNPSAMGLSKVDGQRLYGAQMVDVLNAIGLDYAVFGNHEFDLDEKTLMRRIDESDFRWVSSNTFHRKGLLVTPFFHDDTPILPYGLLEFPQRDGEIFRVAILSVCLNANNPRYVRFHDPYRAARTTYDYLADKVDVQLGLTHLSIEQDRQLAKALPEFPLIMGGHEHSNHVEMVGQTRIAKADANARTAYVHRCTYDPNSGEFVVNSELVPLDSNIVPDPELARRVAIWEDRAYAGLRSLGFDLEAVVYNSTAPLDARESSIRTRPTNFGKILAEAAHHSWPESELAIVNSGGVRIDDELRGSISQLDVVRALPFGGAVVQVEIRGDILADALKWGLGPNKGSGGYLQTWNVSETHAGYAVSGRPIETDRSYRVAMPEFLLSGREKNLDFLAEGSDGLGRVIRPAEGSPATDIRLALIDYWRAH